MGLICTGRLQYPALKRFYEGHISANSILCTDSAHGYATLSDELHLNHIKIESGKRKKDIYHNVKKELVQLGLFQIAEKRKINFLLAKFLCWELLLLENLC